MKQRLFSSLALLAFLSGCGGSGSEREPIKSQASSSKSLSSAVVASQSTTSLSSEGVLSSWSSQLSGVSSSIAYSSIQSASSSVFSENSSQHSASSMAYEQALDIYRATVELPVVQSRCVNCHVAGGISGQTRLLLSAGSNKAEQNYLAIKNFVQVVENGDTLILSKTQGGALHQGGSVFGGGTTEFLALKSVLELMTGKNSSLETPALFDGVENATQANTLRRASLIVAGRLPTEAELTLAETKLGFKLALRGLMSGSGFHEFIVRAANDRLLTDAFNQGLNLDVLDPNGSYYPALAAKFVAANEQSLREDFYSGFNRELRFGVSHSPLELIAYVVENEKPYTEILTADYTLANRALAEVYNVDVTSQFAGADYSVFKPVKNRGQILHDDFFSSEFIEGIGSVIDTFGNYVDYPHAGILNEPAFLNRYPTTDTNRNRARARWTYYHFLGVDIEKSAARTNDAQALADTNNPTRNNANCTVCHQTMDPVAGAFQNYGDEGIYRNGWGGLDALPWPYKNDDLYKTGDTWYRDMLAPGFGLLLAPEMGSYSNANSLQWLALQIVADQRFAEAAIQFWWPAIMAEELIKAPEAISDENYNAQLAAFSEQDTFIKTLASDFRKGINGGQAYNLKDAFVEMLASPWFMARQASKSLPPIQHTMLAGVGVGRLLTPEELEAKTTALIGYAWGASDAPWLIDNQYTNLLDRYLIYYGGIDSVGITSRARTLNTLMANVALTQAVSVACGAVVMDFNAVSPKLFSMIDRYVTPVSHGSNAHRVTGTDFTTASEHVLPVSLPSGTQQLAISFENPHWDAGVSQGTNLIVTRIRITNGDGTLILDKAGELLPSIGAEFSMSADGNATGSNFYDALLGKSAGVLLWSGNITVPVEIPAAGEYTVTVSAWRRNLPSYPVNMVIGVNSSELYANTKGEQLLRQQLVRLHDLFLGQALTTDSPEVDASYNLLVDTWQWRQSNMPQRAYDWETEGCDIPVENWWQQDWTRELADPNYMLGAWTSLLIYLMTDYHYLHE